VRQEHILLMTIGRASSILITIELCERDVMSERARLLIVDDLPRARQGLQALLATYPEFEVVGEGVNGCEALQLAETLQPDLILMDARMPAMDGLEATRQIRARWPGVRVIVWSMYADTQPEALRAGAAAFVNKGAPPDELIQVLRVAPV
jgi:DNA-binding NarL/FixJ family response regulator